MGWSETTITTTKSGARPTTAELTDAFFEAALSGTEKFEVLASAHKPRGGVDQEGFNNYTLWLYGRPYWGGHQGETATVMTVLLGINWATGTIIYKDFGLDSLPQNIPPASFLKALPKSLGSDYENEQLEAIYAHKKRVRALGKELKNGALVSLGYTVEFANGMRAEWFEVCTHLTRTGRKTINLRIDGTPVYVNLGRDWRSKVKKIIPLGAVEPVTL